MTILAVADTDLIASGRAALADGDWLRARDAFAGAAARGDSADALDGLGRALWWQKDVAAAMDARTRAYVSFRRQGRFSEAATTAVWLAREHRALYRNDTVADGWLARGESMCERAGDSPASGWLLVARAEATPKPAAGIDWAERAIEIARAADDADLEIVALARLGALEIMAGAVEAGLAHIDEAMAAATAGEGRDPQSVGEACCALMDAAALVGETQRIARWAPAVEGFRAAYDFGPLAGHLRPSSAGALSPFCGACCGGIYLVSGRLDEAESELIAAIQELEAAQMHSRCVHPVTQLAELRVLQGRLEEAESLLSRYEHLPECVRPLAALDLARGVPDVARRRLLARIEELEGLDVLALPLWMLLVDADLAAGDLNGAARAADAVARVASLTSSGAHAAEALFAKAKVCVAGAEEDGQALLREAAGRLASAGLPLAACRARLEFARAVAAADPGRAIAEARGALAALERLGAVWDADAAAAFLREMGVRGRTGPKDIALLSRRELEVLRLVAYGLSNREISQRLFISVKTAGNHVSSILSKLGLRSRTEAAAYAALNLPASGAGNGEGSPSSASRPVGA